MKNCNLISTTIAALALQSALPAAAANDDWDVVLTPYVWAVGIDGDIQAGGEDINVAQSFSDIVENLDMGAEGILEFNKGRWVNFLQADYISMDTGDIDTHIAGVDGDLEFKSTIATFGTGYRFETGKRSTLDVMAGVRFTRFEARISIQTQSNANGDEDLYDGVLVLRPRLNITGDWYFSPTMSVGAGDSELTWEMSPQFMYDCGKYQFRIGYRNLNYDFEKGNLQMDQSMRGPMIGMGMQF
jgi:hypothetical protein